MRMSKTKQANYTLDRCDETSPYHTGKGNHYVVAFRGRMIGHLDVHASGYLDWRFTAGERIPSRSTQRRLVSSIRNDRWTKEKTMTLTQDNRYETDALTFMGWSTGETHIPGMDCWAYFDRDGRYLGPDEEGIEPVFVLAEGSVIRASSDAEEIA